MKILILESCSTKDGDLEAGKVYDVPENDARLLVAIRRASYAIEATTEASTSDAPRRGKTPKNAD